MGEKGGGERKTREEKGKRESCGACNVTKIFGRVELSRHREEEEGFYKLKRETQVPQF